MLVSDLLHSCANDCVAEAAVSSIGGEFASRMQSAAEQRGVSVGFLAAGLVRDFERGASERDWRQLIEAIRGHDFPVLAGLQVILTKPDRSRRPPDNPMRAQSLGFPAAAGSLHLGAL